MWYYQPSTKPVTSSPRKGQRLVRCHQSHTVSNRQSELVHTHTARLHTGLWWVRGKLQILPLPTGSVKSTARVKSLPPAPIPFPFSSHLEATNVIAFLCAPGQFTNIHVYVGIIHTPANGSMPNVLPLALLFCYAAGRVFPPQFERQLQNSHLFGGTIIYLATFLFCYSDNAAVNNSICIWFHTCK